MMSQSNLNKAKRLAAHYGKPGLSGVFMTARSASNKHHRYGTPTPKTGFFTGYWNCGAVAWQGHFENGELVGMWKYTSPNGVDNCVEFYCNL